MALRGSGFRFFKDVQERALIRREARRLNLPESVVGEKRMKIKQAGDREFSRQLAMAQRRYFSDLRTQAQAKARQAVQSHFQKSERKVFRIPESVVRKDSLLGKIIGKKR